jgi:hypothetical protein
MTEAVSRRPLTAEVWFDPKPLRVLFVVTPKSTWQHEAAERQYAVTLRSPCILGEHQLSIDGLSKQQFLVSTEMLKRSKYFSRVSVSLGAQSYLSVG